MELRLLGPVELSVGGETLDAGPLRQRLVLAALAAEAGRPVSVETLIHRVWDDEPPEQPRRALHVYLSRIRRLLATADLSRQPPVAVVRRSGGYLLDLDPQQVDVHRFHQLVSRARHRQCPVRERATLFRQALELWRGPPLADLPGQWADRVRQGWLHQYQETVVAWALTCLHVGDPGTVLPRLRELIGEHPLAESLAVAYMRALCAAGRPAEALDHYTTIRRRLAEELGIDPGPELQRLHRQILAADPTLNPPPASLTLPAPRQLPAPPQLFTGRTQELAELNQLHDASTVVINAIDGMAGVGKTTLVVEAAHRIADRYPDGQLFIDLHGYTEGVAPVEPAEALDHMLRALGIPGPQIPHSLDQRAALYRTRLADQRMLIVLDNAAAEDQVKPLLPGSRGCLVLVTSRRRLAGLDHTHTLSLDVLPYPDAVTLFRRSAGEGRLAGQPPDRVAELVELCGRLPLAIQIAAARLRSHPAWSLSDLVQRLRDQRHRLVELQAGQRSITAALDLSYEHLSADQQRTYRLLGMHPGPDIDTYATAALLDSTPRDAGRTLDQLLDAHLLLEPVAGRYRFHDLTRAHAAHTASRDETDCVGVAAVERLLAYYRHTAAAAMDAAYTYERERRPQVPPARTPSPDLSDPALAVGWLDTELANLLAAATYAAEHSRPAHILHLSTILHRHFRTRGRYRDALALHHQALITARATGDHEAELAALVGLGHIHSQRGLYEQATDHHQQALQLARAIGSRCAELDALTGLGQVHWLQGRYEQATDHHRQALQLARDTGNHSAELTALGGLGHIHRQQGRYQQATDHHQQALQLARDTGNHSAELNALIGLGEIDLMHGRYEQATHHYRQVLRIARDTGNRPGELTALNGLGHIRYRQGRYEQAADHFEQALELARATGHRPGELNALCGLGHIHRGQGQHGQATGHYQQLLDLAHESGDRNFEFEARQGLGRLQQATGHPDAAITHHDQALTVAAELGQPDDQARAHDGLAHAHHALHQNEQARRHWQHALNLLTGLGIDHTDDAETTAETIRANLASLDHQQTR